MSSIKILVKGKFETDNFIHEHFDENDPPPRADIIKKQTDVVELLEGFNESKWKLIVQSSNGKGSKISFELRHENISNGGTFSINAHPKKAAIITDVDAEFTYELDADKAKELKKSYSAGTLKLYLTNIGARWEIETPWAYSNVSGKIKDGDWEDDNSWPAVSNFESDVFTKKSATKAKPTLIIPVNIKTSMVIDKSKVKSIKTAIKNGMVTRVGLCIPRGSNSFLVKSTDWVGSSNFSLQGGILNVDINATYTIEVDTWIKKYKDQAPFSIEVDCIFDADGGIHYFGECGEDGYFKAIRVGEVAYP